MDSNFNFKEGELGPMSKKALQELLDNRELEKSEDGYKWTEKGMIEIQKSLFRFQNIWSAIFKKK